MDGWVADLTILAHVVLYDFFVYTLELYYREKEEEQRKIKHNNREKIKEKERKE